MYEMKPEYYTGIDFIDEEHTRLFAIADEAYELLKNQFIPDKYDYIMNLIEELKDYTKYHFQHEEEYMNSIGYKKVLSHKVAHDDFIQKINEFDPDKVDKNPKDTLLELVDFLATWLVLHISKADKLIAEYKNTI
ncbi:MAG TPA: hemerythrin family protein [Acetivibrio sp.]|jgi:hemerythrin|nr:hemerythrin family protein [Clostridium sp.]HOQ37090.1 hemerythrin family protein [Acetivibrio sp.]HPT90990.1 hemerythrin family protein [Acetivibrio sp.]HQA57915.1 hemerythrin family protein [Acetivibrio sp.]